MFDCLPELSCWYHRMLYLYVSIVGHQNNQDGSGMHHQRSMSWLQLPKMTAGSRPERPLKLQQITLHPDVLHKVSDSISTATWLILVMINDLETPADLWEYVDDTSYSEIVTKGSESKLQEAVDDLSRQGVLMGSN